MHGNHQRMEGIKTNRIWELDFIRGFCILLMIMDHTFYDLAFLFPHQWFPGGEGSGALFWFSTLIRTGYYPWIVRDVIWLLAVFCFVFVSGISSSFSHSNLKRGLRLAAVALALSLFTLGLDLFTGQEEGYFIRFGILHLLATSIILYSLIQKIGKKALVALGIASVLVGFYFMQAPLETSVKALGILAQSTSGFRSADYFPILPWVGFFLIGAVIGPGLYGNRQSRFPRRKVGGFLKSVLFVGRHSLVIYVIHQPIVFGVLYLIGILFVS